MSALEQSIPLASRLAAERRPSAARRRRSDDAVLPEMVRALLRDERDAHASAGAPSPRVSRRNHPRPRVRGRAGTRQRACAAPLA